MNTQAILNILQTAVPSLSAVYLFGSQASGEARPDSDWDLAILADTVPDALGLWELADSLAALLGGPVDLLNLRAASTVMQYRIITTGQRLWCRDSSVANYESFILSEKTALDEARSALLNDIRQTGNIYGR